MNPVSKFTPKVRREKTALSNSDLSKDAVKVFCRLRPLKHDLESTCIKLLSPTILSLNTPAECKGVRKEVHCQFKHIFTSYATQKEVFEHIAYPLLEDLLKGKNGLLFTYGVTGSGKTHTLTGDQHNPGIMPKCIYTIFNTIGNLQARKYVIKSDRMNGFEVQSTRDAELDRQSEMRTGSKTPLKTPKRMKDKMYDNDDMKIKDVDRDSLYSVFVSYIEIYNNTVFDLLDESTGRTIQGKILREDSQKNMYVNGVNETEVKSAEEAFELFNIGQKRKKMGNTILNAVSSRSHSIFNIRVVQFQQTAFNDFGHPAVPDTNLLKVAQLSLVDLAGSERTARTQNTGQMLREASQINNSLLTLRTCMDILRENQQTGSSKLVPYRDSRLTLLFKNYFEGEGGVSMIVCVNPSVEDFEENFQVMKFAEATQDVKVTRAEAKYTPCKRKVPHKATPHTIKSKSVFTLGPKIPKIRLNFSSYEECQIAMEGLHAALRTSFDKNQTVGADLDNRESHFRKRLIEVQQQNILGRSDLKSARAQLKREKQKSSNMESKVTDMEVKYNELLTKNKGHHDEILSLQHLISEKEVKINKNVLEKEKVKQKLALQSEKMSKELDQKLRRQREHLQAAMRAKESKIQKAREVLDSEITPPEVEEKEQREHLQEYIPPAETPKQTRRHVAVSSSARQRRSRSAGEMWLEHNSVKPVPLGTVMQPTMKKRKSVTKLSKATDITNPKQSKYCLIAQEQNDEGDLETKVFKADIVPTCGGGAQVIFNDVETLKQTSPTAGS